MLAEVPRQVLEQRPERGEHAEAGMPTVAPGFVETLDEQILGILVAPVRHEL